MGIADWLDVIRQGLNRIRPRYLKEGRESAFATPFAHSVDEE
jgi:hypothetical protein